MKIEQTDRPRDTATGSVVKTLLVAAITFALGFPLVIVVYFAVQPDIESENSTEARHNAERPLFGDWEEDKPDVVANLEEMRKFMSDEEFEETFGPAIQRELDNPTTYVYSKEDLNSLPGRVNRLVSPNITDQGLGVLADKVSVVELDLSDNQFITNAGMVHIAEVKDLKQLRLGSTRVTDEGIKHLRKLRLEYINLWHTDVGDQGLGFISEMSSMKQLQIKGCTRVTDAGVNRLSGLPTLWMVNLSHCTQISDKSIRTLSGMPSVNFVQVFNCADVSEGAVDDFLDAQPDRRLDR